MMYLELFEHMSRGVTRRLRRLKLLLRSLERGRIQSSWYKSQIRPADDPMVLSLPYSCVWILEYLVLPNSLHVVLWQVRHLYQRVEDAIGLSAVP